MQEMILGMVGKDNPVELERIKRDREETKRKAEHKKRQQLEDIRILQGKLLMLKRWMATQGALKAVDDIINPVQ